MVPELESKNDYITSYSKYYTGMVSKIGNMTRRHLEFFPGAAKGEAAQLEQANAMESG